MKKQLITFIGSGALVATLVITGVSFAKSKDTEVHDGTTRINNQVEADFPSLAKVTFDQAVLAAQAKEGGRVLKIELGDENGFLVYEIELVMPDKSILDVKVDAGSGEILATEQDRKDRDDNAYDEEESEQEDGDHDHHD